MCNYRFPAPKGYPKTRTSSLPPFSVLIPHFVFLLILQVRENRLCLSLNSTPVSPSPAHLDTTHSAYENRMTLLMSNLFLRPANKATNITENSDFAPFQKAIFIPKITNTGDKPHPYSPLFNRSNSSTNSSGDFPSCFSAICASSV